MAVFGTQQASQQFHDIIFEVIILQPEKQINHVFTSDIINTISCVEDDNDNDISVSLQMFHSMYLE